MTVQVFIDASVTYRHVSIGAYLILKGNNYTLSELKPKVLKLRLQTYVLATMELAIEVMNLVSKQYPDQDVIVYTNCGNLYSIKQHDPKLLSRNNLDLYNPLLDLLEHATLIRPNPNSKESEILKIVSTSAQRQSKL